MGYSPNRGKVPSDYCQVTRLIENTMNISLPAPPKSFVDKQVVGRGYGTCSRGVAAIGNAYPVTVGTHLLAAMV